MLLLKRILLLGIFTISGGFVLAQSSIDPMNLPSLTSYVNDYSQIISETDLANINALADNYDNKTTNQLVTVLFPNRNGNELFDIGMDVFKKNQIGQAGKNNGLLLLISTDEKKIRIIVGYGLEGVMPDVLASRIIEEDIRPLVNSGDIIGAVKKFYERSIKAIDTDEAANIQESGSSKNSDKNSVTRFLGAILGFILALIIKQKTISKSVKKIGIPLLSVFFIILLVWLGSLLIFGLIAGLVFGFTGFMPGRGGRGGFGGGFGGGFSGGGGSSGGGGAGD